jgi:hypothetical protein
MKGRQAGAATLFVTVIILALLTVIAAVSAKIGMFELKTSANTNRAKEALHAAQGGLDYGAVRYLDDASWAGDSLYMPYGSTDASVSVSAVAGTDSVVLNAVGESVDTTGLARIEEKFARVPIFDVGELPPLMANGNFPDSGSFSIVTNPNGGGSGVPVSGWTSEAVKKGVSNWRTCNVDEWLYDGDNDSKAKLPQSDGFTLCHTCRCTDPKILNPICDPKDVAVNDTYDCTDIVIDDPFDPADPDNPDNIPDVFTNLFGMRPWDTDSSNIDDWYEFIEAIATVKLGDCTSLGANSGDQFYGSGVNAGKLPLIWIEGDCDINGAVASYGAPVILFIHGNVTLNGGAVFYGILFGFSDKYDQDPTPNDEDFTIKTTGSPTLYGVLLSNQNLDATNGSFSLVYSETLLEKLVNVGDTFYELARYPGSWTDTK